MDVSRVPVDGYLLLSGGTDADIKAIVSGAAANGARHPGLLLSDATFQAFVPIDADHPADFEQRVGRIVGGRRVNIATFTVACTTHLPGQHASHIKRTSFIPGGALAFAIVKVEMSASGDVHAALAAIRVQGFGASAIVEGSQLAHILVEVQEKSLADLERSFARLSQVNGIGFQRLGAHPPASDSPGVSLA